MSKTIGQIEWRDLTVKNAESVRTFYEEVVGWKSDSVSMGDYNDFSMVAENGETVAGVCHARGCNSKLPPQWLMYVRVEDVNKSIEVCIEKGGKLIDGPRAMGGASYCVIEDPEGAVLALVSGN